MTLEELQVVIDAQTKPFRDELERLNKQMKNTTNSVEKQTTKIRNSFSKVKRVISGLLIGTGLAKLGKEAITIASDIQEVQNVVDTAFGSMKYKVEEFSKTALQQFGLSELTAKRTSSIYMAMSKGMGIAEDAASDMAIAVAGLSGDVASFYNVSQSVADTALQSIWTGETESLKRFGVVMTQANLKQFALNNGLDSNIEKMDQASLTMLRYQYVMSQFGLAQGDFARTSGSWANQVRILQEQWKQLLGIIGSGLVAVLTPVIQTLNKVIGKVIQFAKVLQGVFSQIFGKSGNQQNKQMDQYGASVSNAANAQSGLSNAISNTGKQAEKTAKKMGGLMSFDEINNISSSSGSSADNGSSPGIDIGGINTGIGGMFSEEIDTSNVDKAVNDVMKKLNEFKKFMIAHKNVILPILGAIAGGLGSYLVLRNWDTLIKPISKLTTYMSNLFKVISVGPAGWQALITSMTGISVPAAAVVALIAAISGAFVQLWLTSDEWKAKVIEAWENVKDVLSSVWENVIQPIFNGIVVLAKTVWEGGLKPLWEAWVNLVEVISSAILDLWNFLAPYVEEALEYLGPIFTVAFETLGKVVGTVINTILGIIKSAMERITMVIDLIVSSVANAKDSLAQVLDAIGQIFSGIIDFIAGVFTLDFERAISGIINIFKGLWNGLVGIVKSVWNTILGLFANGGKIFSGVVEGIANVFKNIVNTIIRGINKVIAFPFNKINGLLNSIRNIKIPLIGRPFSGLWGPNPLPVPQIPEFARGGVVDRATLGIFGEAGKEAVLPLENNTGWISKLAADLSLRTGSGVNEDMNDIIILLQELIRLIREKPDPTFEFDGEKVNKSNSVHDYFRKLRTG